MSHGIRTKLANFLGANISRSKQGVTLTLGHSNGCDFLFIMCKCQSHTLFKSASIRIE